MPIEEEHIQKDSPEGLDPSGAYDLIAAQVEANNINAADLNFRQRCYDEQKSAIRSDIWVRLATAVITSGKVSRLDVNREVKLIIDQYDEYMRS